MKFADIKPVPGYEELERVLCAAYMQAAVGKGAERHADAKPFTEQPMQTIAQSYGTVDGMMFQVSKKLGESRGLPAGRAQAEVLGAIVYSAGVHIAYDSWAPRKEPISKPEAVKSETADNPLSPEARLRLIERLRNENRALYTDVGREFLARIEKAKARFLGDRGRFGELLRIGRLEQALARAAFHAGGHLLPENTDLAQCALNGLTLVPTEALTEFVVE